MTAFAYCHPTIGDIQGRFIATGVVQFTGLAYATIRDRFAAPELKEYDSHRTAYLREERPENSLQNGNDVSSCGTSVTREHALNAEPDDLGSDMEVLSINVTLPLAVDGNIHTNRQLPVFVLIQGGESHAAWTVPHDTTTLVETSRNVDSPLISVTFNYRDGAPGFLTSTELREAGYGTNNVLRDQLTALKWIQKHITGFSGDPQNVTLAGEKIGAACIAYQMHNPEPLFSRIMLISGSHFLQPPISFETAEENYQKIIDVLGLKSCSPEERIRALLSADGQTLNKELARAGITMLPVLDYDLIEHMPTFESTTTGSWQCPGRGHFKGAIIGDCHSDAIPNFRPVCRDQALARAVYSSFTNILGAERAAHVLSAYALDPDASDEDATQRVLVMYRDMGFFAPTLAYASNLHKAPMPVYVYRCNRPPPSPQQGHFPWHAGVEPSARAREFAERIVAFVNGREPWQAWRGPPSRKSHGKVALVLGGEDGLRVRRDESPENGRGRMIMDLSVTVGMDRLYECLMAFFFHCESTGMQ